MLQNEDLRLYQAISLKVFQARQGGSLIRKAERIHGHPRKLKQPAKKAEATARLMADNLVQKSPNNKPSSCLSAFGGAARKVYYSKRHPE